MIIDDKGTQDIESTAAIGPALPPLSHRRFIKSDDETGDTYRQSLLLPAPAQGAGSIETFPITLEDGTDAVTAAMLFCQCRKIESLDVGTEQHHATAKVIEEITSIDADVVSEKQGVTNPAIDGFDGLRSIFDVLLKEVADPDDS